MGNGPLCVMWCIWRERNARSFDDCEKGLIIDPFEEVGVTTYKRCIHGEWLGLH